MLVDARALQQWSELQHAWNLTWKSSSAWCTLTAAAMRSSGLAVSESSWRAWKAKEDLLQETAYLSVRVRSRRKPNCKKPGTHAPTHARTTHTRAHLAVEAGDGGDSRALPRQLEHHLPSEAVAVGGDRRRIEGRREQLAVGEGGEAPREARVQLSRVARKHRHVALVGHQRRQRQRRHSRPPGRALNDEHLRAEVYRRSRSEWFLLRSVRPAMRNEPRLRRHWSGARPSRT